MQGAIADNSGVIDKDIDWSGGCLDLPDAVGAILEVADVPAIDVDARVGAECVGGSGIACVGRGHAIAGLDERIRNSSPDATRSARDQCNPCHLSFLNQPKRAVYADVPQYLYA